MKSKVLLGSLLLCLSLPTKAADNVWQWATRAGGESSDSANRILPGPGGGSYTLSSFTRDATFGTNQIIATADGSGLPAQAISRLDDGGQFLWSYQVESHANSLFPAPNGGLRVLSSWTVLVSVNPLQLEPHWILSRYDTNGTVVSTTQNPAGAIGVDEQVVAAVGDSSGGVEMLMGSGALRKIGADDQLAGTIQLTPAPAFTVVRMAVDGGGNVVLAGATGGYNFVVARYAANGTRSWLQSFGGGDPQFGAQVTDLVVDAAGNPIVTGSGDVGGPVTHFVAKIDAGDGHLVWSRQIGPVPGNIGTALGLDGQGRIYNAGTFYGDAQLGTLALPGHGYSEAFLARLEPDGTVDWVETFGGTESYQSFPEKQDVPTSIAVSAVGDVTIAGQFWRTSYYGPLANISVGDADAFVVRFGVTPVVQVESSGLNLLVGQVASFSAHATGKGPFTYQWYKGGAPIDGATQANYVISPLKAGDEGEYSVQVTGAVGTATSKGAVLVVRTEGIAIQLYAGIQLVGVVGNTYEILRKDDVGAPDWTVAATVTLTQTSQVWFDAESPGIPTRIYGFRLKP